MHRPLAFTGGQSRLTTVQKGSPGRTGATIQNPDKTDISTVGGADGGAVPASTTVPVVDADLEAVVRAWPSLDPAVRNAILAIVSAG